MIANAFIPNPENKPYIDHINTDTMDYRIENLRWVTPKENSNNPITKIKCNTNSHSELALAKSKKNKNPQRRQNITKEGVSIYIRWCILGRI